MKTLHVLFILIVLAIVAAGGYYIIWSDTDTVESPAPAPEETGSTSTSPAQTGWTNYDGDGYHFQYPGNLGLTYVHATDWPPSVKVLDTEFACAPAGNEIAATGQTETVETAGRTFCRTKTSEGAAGSIYHAYDYVFAAGPGTVTLSFTVRMPQCANYDEPEATACATEQRAFDPDQLAASMADTFSF